MPDAANLPITARFAGRTHTRSDVLGWERARARKVARRLGIDPADDAVLANVVDRKLELGHTAIRRLLRRDVAVSGPVSRFGAAVSRGRRRTATTTLTCPASATVERFPDWYREHFAANDERPMLAASPDHWLFCAHDDGDDEVLETAAASPFVIQMFFDDTDVSTVRATSDPAFPVEWAAIARSDRGGPIGGICHRFRDEPGGGFTVELNVEFPVTMLPYMITQHCWHLAGEFSNWIELASGVREP